MVKLAKANRARFLPSNVMSTGPAVIRKAGKGTRSNLELVNSLRENFVAAKLDYASFPPQTNGHAPQPVLPSVEIWTEATPADDSIFIPRINWDGAGLKDDPEQYEITVKLFLLPGTPVVQREQYVREALALVTRELAIQTIDLLVVSFPGMSFEGSCEWEADKLNAEQGNLDEETATWAVLELLHQQGVVKRLGVAEFGSEKLRAFIDRTHIPPVVDQINLKDCCSVPPPLMQLAKERAIELNVHNDCTDILPPGTLRQLLGQGSHGAGVLATDPNNGGEGIKGEIVPQWVVRYMAFVKDRGVIENKGYFAGAELVH